MTRTSLDRPVNHVSLAVGAAGAIIAAAHRAHAPTTDRDRALRALFTPPRTTPPRHPSQVNQGIPLSPADKTRIRALLTAGAEPAAAAAEVGCSIQAVAGVLVALRRQARP